MCYDIYIYIYCSLNCPKWIPVTRKKQIVLEFEKHFQTWVEIDNQQYGDIHIVSIVLCLIFKS